jgi:hypothetical protein
MLLKLFVSEKQSTKIEDVEENANNLQRGGSDNLFFAIYRFPLYDYPRLSLAARWARSVINFWKKCHLFASERHRVAL